MAPVIPAPNPDTISTTSNVALTLKLWAELDAVAAYEAEKEAKRADEENRDAVSYSRTKIMRHFLEWALTQYWDEEDTAAAAASLAKPSLRRPELVAQALAKLEEEKKKRRK